MIHRFIYFYIIIMLSIIHETFGQEGVVSPEILTQNTTENYISHTKPKLHLSSEL